MSKSIWSKAVFYGLSKVMRIKKFLLSGGLVFGITLAVILSSHGIGMASDFILHGFGGTDGSNPRSSLTLLGSTLYGTSDYGGLYDTGTIFQINADGTGYKVLHNFSGSDNGGDGALPHCRLVLSGSTLYGVTHSGGNGGGGTVFSINTDGTGYTVLYWFGEAQGDGMQPYGSLTISGSGSTLYGMTAGGGSGGDGTIFRINTDGTGYKILHDFVGTTGDGTSPYGTLTISGSTLYGMTRGGGSGGYGIIFQINTDGSGYKILHNFSGGQNDGAQYGPTSAGDGQEIHCSLTLSGSTLYGMTFTGGSGSCSHAGIATGCGTVFQINTDGTGFNILHSFASGPNDGQYPCDSLWLSGSTLYGMTLAGGSGSCSYEGVEGCGTVFQINTDSTGYQVLYNFAGGSSDGEYPYDTPTLSGSTLYGTASAGGSGNGTIFSLKVSSAGGLWHDAADLGGGWKWLKWFGYFHTGSSPWIYHMQHGWLYPFGTSTNSIWFYDSAMGTFWWTSAAVYPYVYRAGDRAWLYYDVGTSSPRWFFNFSTKQWEKY